MVSESSQSPYRHTNLTNESDGYLAKRETLRLAEIELMRQREAVAALRRDLPEGPALRDYEFLEGPADLAAGDEPVRVVKLSELFSSPSRSLIIYHLMFGKQQVKPCPMCTMWIDSLEGMIHHLTQNADVAIVAAAALAPLRDHARARGWNNLRLLSAGLNTFKFDLGSEDADGAQDSAISVLTRGEGGVVRHFYTAHPRMGPDVKERGIDFMAPVWSYLDLTPEGRGNWYSSLDYGVKARID